MQYSALAASLAPGMEKEEAYIELLDAAQVISWQSLINTSSPCTLTRLLSWLQAYLAAQARLQRSTTQVRGFSCC
jgi:hypothetical protein